MKKMSFLASKESGAIEALDRLRKIYVESPLDSADVIVGSSRCNEQLFKTRSIAYSIQFHIEIEN